MAKLPRYLFPSDYYADPSANVFNGRLYVYPSHDWEAGAAFDDDGGHFQMKDYHVISMDDVVNGEVTDHGKIRTMMSWRKTASITSSSRLRIIMVYSTLVWLSAIRLRVHSYPKTSLSVVP